MPEGETAVLYFSAPLSTNIHNPFDVCGTRQSGLTQLTVGRDPRSTRPWPALRRTRARGSAAERSYCETPRQPTVADVGVKSYTGTAAELLRRAERSVTVRPSRPDRPETRPRRHNPYAHTPPTGGMDPADREWRLIREEARDGPVNMALDEVAARTAAEDGRATARVYRWEPSTLSLGYHQDPATIDWEFCEREGITVTRRPTGGGAIYHDSRGDISYSLVAPADDLPGDLVDSYELLCEPLFDAFEGMNIEARFADEELPAVHEPACYLRGLHPAHDVVAGDGRKISGNAQYRQRNAVIQHGSLTFERATERHLACFADCDVGPDAFEERVTAVRDHSSVSRETAVEALEASLADWTGAHEGEWPSDELEHARDRVERKYATTAWTRDGQTPR